MYAKFKKLAREYLLPSEVVVIAYLMFTTLIILIFSRPLSIINFHFLFRGIAILLFLFLAYIYRKLPVNRWLLLPRLILTFILLAYIYSETDYLNNFLFEYNFDPMLAHWEQNLFGLQPSLKFSELLPSPLFAEFMYFGYFSYYLMIVGIPFYIFLKISTEIGLRVIFYIISSFLIYYLIFIIFPAAGPQYFFANTLNNLPEGYIFGWAIHIIQQRGEAPTAAFPSSHVGVCLILIWIAYKHAKPVLWYVIPVSFLLLLSTIYLKAHYVVDIFAAILTFPFVYLISNWLFRVINGGEFIIFRNYADRD